MSYKTWRQVVAAPIFLSMRAFAVLAFCATAAHAGPSDSVNAGPQPAPPVATPAPKLDQELDGRRNIRGCAVGESCARASDLLREFEVEAFPPPGASPWLDERAAGGSRLEASTPRKV